MSKGPDAFRTISEVAEGLDLPQHVLRFWETRFTQIKPLKRGGGRRYYRPDDIELLRGIRQLLYGEGYTIKGVQRILKEQGTRFVIGAGTGEIDGIALAGQRPLADVSGKGVGEVDEAGPDGDSSELLDVVPRVGKSKRAATQRRKSMRAARRPGDSALGDDEVKKLRATLSELAECKRILDQTR